MDGWDAVGLERLSEKLAEAGAGQFALEVDSSRHLVRLCLQGAREEGLGFDEAWKMGMARLQPSQAGGGVDHANARDLREDRRLLEEDRQIFRAAYEGRAPTTIERAQRLVKVSGRVDSVLGPRVALRRKAA